MSLVRWLEKMRARKARCLHLRPGLPPLLRIEGRLEPLGGKPLEHHQFDALLRELLDGARVEDFKRKRRVNFLVRREDARCRVELFETARGRALVLHELAAGVPSPAELDLPAGIIEFTALDRGLLLFSGPIGAGVTTTLHSFAAELSARRPLHVLTLEARIELPHEAGGPGFVQQLEIGTHVRTASEGLALAQSVGPDVLVLGSIDDGAILARCLHAVEGGMLVLAGLHAGSAAEALGKLDEFLPQGVRPTFRRRLAGALKAVFCQVLVERATGTGRIPAVEILVASGAVQEAIRTGQLATLGRLVEEGRGLGMCSLDDALYDLVARGLVDVEVARAHASDKERFAALGPAGVRP